MKNKLLYFERRNIMTRRQLYFLKQKLIGVGFILLPILAAMVFVAEVIVAGVITWPLGLMLIFTKDYAIMDDYYWELAAKGFEDDEEL
jgi:hypothetical protein